MKQLINHLYRVHRLNTQTTNLKRILTFPPSPHYITDDFLRSSELKARGRLCSASSSSSSLIVRRTRLSTVGNRAFPVAAALVWKDRTTMCRLHHPYKFSVIVWRLVFSSIAFPTFAVTAKWLVSLSDTLITLVTYLYTTITRTTNEQ